VVAPASVYAPAAGVLWKLFTVILFVPSVIVTSVAGSVIVITLVGSPEIVNEATVLVGAKPERVTPPVAERTLAGVTVTTPDVVPLHITPKCKSAVCTMERGAIITADAEAEAVVCAKIPEEKPSITTAIAKNLTIFFIFLNFFWLVIIFICIRNNIIRIIRLMAIPQPSIAGINFANQN
jgi:hypothetical protein